MINFTKNKILKSKLYNEPFPYFVVNNLIPKPKLDKLNKVLPSFDEVSGKDILYQSTSKTKKTFLPSSKLFKQLKKKKIFKEVDLLFNKLKPLVVKKFEKEIKKYVSPLYQKKKLNYHSSFSIMKKGYIKSPHVDRRDHLVHILFYPFSDNKRGGDIQVEKLINNNKKKYDVFPNKNETKVYKRFQVKNNFCIFTLNVPWSYHSVNEYRSFKDRKYFYAVYDFPIKKIGSNLNNRKKGFNSNSFWIDNVTIKSARRKKIFLSE